MSHPAAPISLDKLNKFQLDRVLNEDPLTHTLTLLGTLPGEDTAPVKAIVRIEKTALNSQRAGSILGEDGLIHRVTLEESTDIVCAIRSPFFADIVNPQQYTWLFGWLREDRERDVKINIICPATDVHVRKVCQPSFPPRP